MEPIEDSFITILLVADRNFRNLCVDPQTYIEDLKERIPKLRQGIVTLCTVSGAYGLSSVDNTLPVIEVTDRNKTLFSQTLENSSILFDEMITISISDKDQFIAAARDVTTGMNKTYTTYKYRRRD